MQSYESDGSTYGKKEYSFKLSDTSRESKSSRDLIDTKDLKMLDKGKAKDMGLGVCGELNDVSRLLEPERPGLVHLKSTEGVERASRQVV